jgi:hypothetical protein
MSGPSLGVLGATALLITGVFFSVASAVLAKLSGDEVSGWLPVWSNRLLDSAVSRVPPEHQNRYREEWKAELAAFRDRKLSGLRFAWRLRRRARRVSAALVENDGLDSVFESEPQPISRRPLDPSTIASIVQRAVERTKPANQAPFAEIVREMREVLGNIEEDEVAHLLTQAFVVSIAEMRREARIRPSLPAMRPQAPLPPPRRWVTEPVQMAEWESDYDADWGFLWSEGRRTEHPVSEVGHPYRQPQACMGRKLRSWLRGEIWL